MRGVEMPEVDAGKSVVCAIDRTRLLDAASRCTVDRNGRDETRYLRPLEESIARGITPAEELLEKFHGEWGGNVDRIYDEFAY